jgi:arginine decarboxylase
MRQDRAPLFEALCLHVARQRGNYHVPGHKQGRAFDEEGLRYFRKVLELDMTEVGDLDDLHDPQGVIAEAQELAAELFRADHTLFLVGGTTAGNLAVLLHLCRPGDEIIVHRASHQSVFHGLMLAGAKPVYLSGELDEHGREKPLKPDQVQELIRRFPKAKGVMVTSPTYFGMVQSIAELAEVCHHHGIPLVVDEAHGAHLGFHPGLPPSAMDEGADAAIQSTHKMLPAMTMASMLHVRGELLDVGEIARWLRVIESSSPSYPLMASLDLARRYMARHGCKRLGELLEQLDHFRGNIDELRHLEEVHFAGRKDPLKLSVRAKNGVSGFHIAAFLEERGIFSELSDHEKVLFAFSPGTDGESLRILRKALQELDMIVSEERSPHRPVQFPAFSTEGIGIPMDELRRKGRKVVPLREAAGRVSTGMIVPYPPGVPLVLPGETFTAGMVEFLERLLADGGKVRGIRSVSPPVVDVLE